MKQSLVSAFKSSHGTKVKSEIEEGEDDFQEASESKKSGGRWSTTWWQQFTVLLRRGVKERRHDSFSTLKICQIVGVSIIAGLLWWRSAHLQDQIGLLFFTSGFWGFYPLFQAIFTFPKERLMLEKERSSGMYRLSSYFMARTIGDLPLELVLPTVFVTITYWMAGLNPSAISFLRYLFVLLYSIVAAQGIGLALGAIVLDQKSATILGSVIMLSFLLAAGYYVQHVPPFIAWIKYLSLSHYSYKLLVGSIYGRDQTYPCSTQGQGGRCLVGEFPSIKKVGLEGQTASVLALTFMILAYRLVAYIALMRLGRPKN